MWETILYVVLFILSVFLILLILIQRGKGGGLAGALGGMGGQSAFGTKAGDLFTKITIGVVAVWIIMCLITVKILGTSSRFEEGANTSKKPASKPLTPEKPKSDKK